MFHYIFLLSVRILFLASTSASFIPLAAYFWSLCSIWWLASIFEEYFKWFVVRWKNLSLRSVCKWSNRWVSTYNRRSQIQLVFAAAFLKRLHTIISSQSFYILTNSPATIGFSFSMCINPLNWLEMSIIEIFEFIEHPHFILLL